MYCVMTSKDLPVGQDMEVVDSDIVDPDSVDLSQCVHLCFSVFNKKIIIFR